MRYLLDLLFVAIAWQFSPVLALALGAVCVLYNLRRV